MHTDWQAAPMKVPCVEWSLTFNDHMLPDYYIDESVKLQDCGRWESAEGLIKIGLKKHPDNIDLLIEFAKISTSRVKWYEARLDIRRELVFESTKRWEYITQNHGSNAPPLVYQEYAYSLMRERRFQEALSVIHEGIEIYPLSSELFIIGSVIIQKQKYYESTVNKIKDVLVYGNKRIGVSLYGPCLSRKLDNLLSHYIYSPNHLKGEEGYKDILCNRPDSSMEHYMGVINKAVSPETYEYWYDSYRTLIDMVIGRQCRQSPSDHGRDCVKGDVNKILVSGMGKSGSGALLHFFNEFDGVVTPGPSELGWFSTDHGFTVLRRGCLNENDFIHSLVDFYWVSLFGYIRYADNNELKASRNAMRYLFDDDGDYAVAVNSFVKDCAEILNLPDYEREELFDGSVARFMNGILRKELSYSGGGRFVLLNNLITVDNVRAVRMLSDFHMFCSFRDPRSQYVAIVREAAGRWKGDGEISVDSFIDEYRSTREAFDRNLKSLGDLGKGIHSVQFERFVLDRDYRFWLAERAGLDEFVHNENAFFRPEESAANIVNYNNFEDSGAINRIGVELSEYCWD